MEGGHRWPGVEESELLLELENPLRLLLRLLLSDLGLLVVLLLELLVVVPRLLELSLEFEVRKLIHGG